MIPDFILEVTRKMPARIIMSVDLKYADKHGSDAVILTLDSGDRVQIQAIGTEAELDITILPKPKSTPGLHEKPTEIQKIKEVLTNDLKESTDISNDISGLK